MSATPQSNRRDGRDLPRELGMAAAYDRSQLLWALARVDALEKIADTEGDPDYLPKEYVLRAIELRYDAFEEEARDGWVLALADWYVDAEDERADARVEREVAG